MNPEQLIVMALAVREKAYAPYSRYKVGAALLADDGTVYGGCNVENASYGLTVCAERAAVFHAVASGRQRFDAIAVATRDGGAPCGACLQVMHEFAPALQVHVVNEHGSFRSRGLAELLPEAFERHATA